MLAYSTALDLPGSLLIYAEGEAEPREYRVRHSGKRLEVEALDLCHPLEAVLCDVQKLAKKIKGLWDEARGYPTRVYAA
jgi:hypothetical protein